MAEWKYAETSREGSGFRDSGSAAKPLILSPRKEGISTPLIVSMGLDRGLWLLVSGCGYQVGAYFANWPAIRPIRTTGLLAPIND